MAFLTLYGAVLTLYGVPLALYGDTPAPVEETRTGGAWSPVILVDRDGKPVDLAATVEAAIEAAPVEEQTEAIEAVANLGPDISRTIIQAQFQRDAAVVMDLLRGFDAVLADIVEAEMKRARQMAIDDDVAIILLMTT